LNGYRGNKMKVIFLNYGGAILSMAGFFIVLQLFERLLLACDCNFAGLVAFLLEGGC
jgi:hypothetical protein